MDNFQREEKYKSQTIIGKGLTEASDEEAAAKEELTEAEAAA